MIVNLRGETSTALRVGGQRNRSGGIYTEHKKGYAMHKTGYNLYKTGREEIGKLC